MWKNIEFNAQNIELYNGNSVLIKFPNKSALKGCTFWHPAKLIRDAGGNGYFKTLGYTDTFEIKIYKNRKEIRTIEIWELEEAFDNPQLQQNVEDNNDSYVRVEEPKKIDKEVEVQNELLNK